MSKTILNIDASGMSKAFCLLHLYLDVVEGWKEQKMSNSIEYGSAFHRFKEVLTETGDEQQAIKAATDYYLTTPMTIETKKAYLNVKHLTLTCLLYTSKFGTSRELDPFKTMLGGDGKKQVESKFAIPYYEDDDVAVILMGTIDDIGKIVNGPYVICDEKSTSSWDVKKYLMQYGLSHQLMFYKNAVEYFAEKYPDSIYADMVKHRFGCRINGVFVRSDKDTEFHSSDIFFYDKPMMDEFRAGLHDTIQRLVYYVKRKERPYREGLSRGMCAGGNFGVCKYFNVCRSPDKESMQGRLKQLFVQKPYNPLLFGGGDKANKEKPTL